jgi:hypothetical protein
LLSRIGLRHLIEISKHRGLIALTHARD